MAKKGEKLSAVVRDRMREAQIERWKRIKAQIAVADKHEANCEHVPNIIINPRANPYLFPSIDQQEINRSVAAKHEGERYREEIIRREAEQHLIDTCLPRCNKPSFWSRLKNYLI
jgi:hypothetical protein